MCHRESRSLHVFAHHFDRCQIDDNDTINVVHRRRRVHEQDLMDDDLEDMVRNHEMAMDGTERMLAL